MIFFDNILFLLPSFTEEQSVLSSKLPKVAILASSAVLWLEERPVHESSEGATLTQLVSVAVFTRLRSLQMHALPLTPSCTTLPAVFWMHLMTSFAHSGGLSGIVRVVQLKIAYKISNLSNHMMLKIIWNDLLRQDKFPIVHVQLIFNKTHTCFGGHHWISVQCVEWYLPPGIPTLPPEGT